MQGASKDINEAFGGLGVDRDCTCIYLYRRLILYWNVPAQIACTWGALQGHKMRRLEGSAWTENCIVPGLHLLELLLLRRRTTTVMMMIKLNSKANKSHIILICHIIICIRVSIVI